MAAANITMLTNRIPPVLEDALRTDADREHRFIANMVAVMIRDYCGRNGITVQEQQALLLEAAPKPQSRKR